MLKLSTFLRKQTYYAVAAGTIPGVYESWNEAQKQISGYSGFVLKKFHDQAAAHHFIQTCQQGIPRNEAQQQQKVAEAVPSSAHSAYYAVAVGKRPGIYSSWAAAEEHVSGFSGAKFRRFSARKEAENYMKQAAVEVEGAAKIEHAQIGDEISATEKKIFIVYTDGSSTLLPCGKRVAGVGVYFGTGDPRNISLAIEGTNIRAEIAALVAALAAVPTTESVLIRTDSQYACIGSQKAQEWMQKTTLLHRDLWKYYLAIMQLRKEQNAETEVEWVRAHAGNQGNEAADRLARAGTHLLPLDLAGMIKTLVRNVSTQKKKILKQKYVAVKNKAAAQKTKSKILQKKKLSKCAKRWKDLCIKRTSAEQKLKLKNVR